MTPLKLGGVLGAVHHDGNVLCEFVVVRAGLTEWLNGEALLSKYHGAF